MNLKRLLSAALVFASVTSWAGELKYIFYYIGDGMGMGPVQAAQNYNRIIRGNSDPLLMIQFPVNSWSFTYSASSDITDSAAAGTALSCGTKTKNGMLGMDPDTTAVTSIAKILFDKGWGVGLTTSVSPSDATPGAFYAHVPSRKMGYEICCQMAESGYQFIGGSGLYGWEKDGKPTDIAEVYARNKVQIVQGPEGLKEIDSDRVLVLNNDDMKSSNIGYTIDSIAGRLTLPMLAEACLKQLEKTSPDRFFMMVEGGNIDHALHGNDGGASIKEVLNFDQALRVAYDFYLAHPDETLIVVTADHDTGGLVLTHPKYSGGGLRNIDYQKVSKEEFSAYCKALLKSRMEYTWDDMKQYLADNLGLFGPIKVSEENEKKLREKFDQTFQQRNSADQKTLYASFNAFAVEVFKLLNKDSGINFATTSHSGNPVPLFAIGVGADEFRHLNNNCDIRNTMLKIVGQNK